MNKRTGRPVTTPDGDNQVARLRRERGWSQAEAAEALGISREQVSRLERGMCPIGGAVLKMVEALLGEDVGVSADAVRKQRAKRDK